VRRRNRRDEELASIGARTRIGHTQQEWSIVDLLEVLVLELLPVDALTASAIALCEVAALDHETFYDAVEGGAFVVEGLARCAVSLLAGAEGSEVLGSLGDDYALLSALL
jgi:hypothetical protein